VRKILAFFPWGQEHGVVRYPRLGQAGLQAREAMWGDDFIADDNDLSTPQQREDLPAGTLDQT
jgi:hypothetical protein